MSLPPSPPVSDSLPGPAAARPPLPDPAAAPLTLRQEAFCRHYAAAGNAAGAARAAGYAECSARQTGHELLARPAVAARLRAIRAAWRTVEREEAQILLGRLEQAWDAAVEKGSASLMLRVVKLQAELSGLDRRNAGCRAGLWPLPGDVPGDPPGDPPGDVPRDVPGEEAFPRPAGGDAAAPGALPNLSEVPPASPPTGPLAQAVRRGRHRTERALAAHRASRKVLELRPDFDEADWLATAQRLHATVEERRPPVQRTEPDRDRNPAGTPVGEIPQPDAPIVTNHDISLRRAGLLPAETAGDAPLDVQRWRDDPFGEARRIRAEGREMMFEEKLAYRAALAADRATARIRYDDHPTNRYSKIPHGGTFLQPAGDPGPEERRAAEEEQDFLRYLARTRPTLASETAGNYLYQFARFRPCRGS